MSSPAAKEYAYSFNFQQEERKWIKDSLVELGALEEGINDGRVDGKSAREGLLLRTDERRMDENNIVDR